MRLLYFKSLSFMPIIYTFALYAHAITRAHLPSLLAMPLILESEVAPCLT